MTTATAPPVTYTEPHRVAPLVPLIVLPGTSANITPWVVTLPSRLSAQAALAALDSLDAAARDADRRALDAALPDAVAALGALATTLARYEPITPAIGVAPGKLIHQYFGMRHSDTMASGSAAFYAVCVFRWCLAELAFASLDANDVLAEITACRQIVRGIAHAPRWNEPGPPAPLDAETTRLLEYLPDGNQWDRWVVAHHGYLLANLLAAGALRRAKSNLWQRRHYASAAEWMRAATVQVRGFTAMMIHSAVLPGRLYVDEIRPSMDRPNLPKPLTGGMFTEHHLYRRHLRALLEDLSEPYATLVRHQPTLAQVRSSLLLADLIDLDGHVRMGYTLLLGDDKSLVQADGESAIDELREMQDRRRAEYRPLMASGAR